jgi:cytochrome c553
VGGQGQPARAAAAAACACCHPGTGRASGESAGTLLRLLESTLMWPLHLLRGALGGSGSVANLCW